MVFPSRSSTLWTVFSGTLPQEASIETQSIPAITAEINFFMITHILSTFLNDYSNHFIIIKQTQLFFKTFFSNFNIHFIKTYIIARSEQTSSGKNSRKLRLKTCRSALLRIFVLKKLSVHRCKHQRNICTGIYPPLAFTVRKQRVNHFITRSKNV